MTTPLFAKTSIIGVGLIGGSLGMALKRSRLSEVVVGVDEDPTALAEACRMEAIDDQYTDPCEAVRSSDLVILAVPVTATKQLLAHIRPWLQPGCIVTDVGSTKGELVFACEELISDKGSFVGGHPMAGSEIGGIAGADPYLFENAVYVLTPTSHTDRTALNRVEQMVCGIGAKPQILGPLEHDAIAGAVSHLPHIAAAALVHAAAGLKEEHPEALVFAAGGFRDTTRVASGSPALWRDICFSNRERVLEMIERLEASLESAKRLLAQGDPEGLRDYFAAAKTVRDGIPARLKGYWPFLEQIVVIIPDQPGTIAQVANSLAQADLNIDDIEILRVREGEGGTLRLGFARAGSAEQAIQILEQEGIPARLLSV